MLLDKGIHPSIIADSFGRAAKSCVNIMEGMSIPVDLNDHESLVKSAATSLASKVVSHHAGLLAPIAVNAVTSILQPGLENVDLRDIKISKKLGGTLDDSEMLDGLVFANLHAAHSAGGPTRIVNPKIAMV
jgi:T-complex protein 1 subunit delta